MSEARGFYYEVDALAKGFALLLEVCEVGLRVFEGFEQDFEGVLEGIELIWICHPLCLREAPLDV